MAFPTSSLTNNQVHKEGNRAFVYDSALGVWDQVRETDSSGILRKDGESISSQVTFPAGHMRQVYHAEHNYDFQTNTVWQGAWGGCTLSGLTSGSKLLRMTSGWVYTDGAGGNAAVMMKIYFCGDSWGGGGGGTGGTLVADGICQYNDAWMTNYFCWINLSPAITVTSGTFALFASNSNIASGGTSTKRFNFQKCYHTFFEVYQ